MLTGTLARTGNVILPGWGWDAKCGPDKVDGSFSEYSEVLGDPSKKLRFATLNFCLFQGVLSGLYGCPHKFVRLSIPQTRYREYSRLVGIAATSIRGTAGNPESRPIRGLKFGFGTRIGGFRASPYNAPS